MGDGNEHALRRSLCLELREAAMREAGSPLREWTGVSTSDRTRAAMHGIPEAELIADSTAHAHSFALLFDRHVDPIYGYIVRRVGVSLAEELTAETFAGAFAQRARFVPPHESAGPWALRHRDPSRAQDLAPNVFWTWARMQPAPARPGALFITDPVADAVIFVSVSESGTQFCAVVTGSTVVHGATSNDLSIAPAGDAAQAASPGPITCTPGGW